MLSLLLVLGGLMTVASVVLLTSIFFDVLTNDDNSWLSVTVAIFMFVGLVIQSILTGGISLGAIFLGLFIALYINKVENIYGTDNPWKALKIGVGESWRNSKLLNRIRPTPQLAAV